MLRGLHRDGAPVKEKLKPTSESSPWVKTNTAKIASGTFDTFDKQEPVKGSTSRKHPELNKVKDLSLSTHDVDGAQPKAGLGSHGTQPLLHAECSFGSLLEGFLHIVWNLMHP